jgi:hypothetical protein
MAFAALLATGAGLGIAGALSSGASSQTALDNQAQINSENATLSLEQGQYSAMRQGMQATQRLGAMRAAYGANGVSSNSGSVIDALQQSATNAEMDNQNIIRGANVKAINYENQAALEKTEGEQAVASSYLSAFGAAAGGGAKYFGQSSGGTPSDDTENEEDQDDTAGSEWGEGE